MQKRGYILKNFETCCKGKIKFCTECIGFKRVFQNYRSLLISINYGLFIFIKVLQKLGSQQLFYYKKYK